MLLTETKETTKMDEPTVVIDAGGYSISETGIQGVGVRLVEFAQVMAEQLPVVVLAEGIEDAVDVGAAELADAADGWVDVIDRCDAVCFFDSPRRTRLEHAIRARRLIVSECRPPIEQLDFPSLRELEDPLSEHARWVATYIRQLGASHHLICRSRAERLVTVAALAAHGRIGVGDIATSRTLDHMITTVPVGYSARSKARADAVEPLHLADFLWTGGMWEFYEPHLLIQAMAELRDRGIETTAAFLYGIPFADTQATIAEAHGLVRSLGLDEQVTIVDTPLPHRQRDAYINAAVGLVCVARPGIENETTVRLRTRDARLFGIPFIVDGHGATGDEVAAMGHGLALREPSAGALADAMAEVLSGRVPMPVVSGVDYDRNLEPVIAWLRAEGRRRA